jgi:hypothetical protein
MRNLVFEVDALSLNPQILQNIPVIHASEWARIPESWLANAHRA